MTAFGKATIAVPLGRFVVEIQSVNRKFLEINLFLPRELNRFDPEIKRWIGAAVDRGQVTVRISAHYEASAPVDVKANIPFAKQLVAALREIAKETGLEPTLDLGQISRHEGVLCYEENLKDEGAMREALREAVSQALAQFIAMREVEGAALADDIRQRLALLARLLAAIEAIAPDSAKKHQVKLIERIEALLPGRVENEERILREIALYAEKADIAEEITRFRSHLDQFATLLAKKEGTVGKTLEFLVQELGREINTIGSKSLDAALAHLVVQAKSELEKIREQIQNIE